MNNISAVEVARRQRHNFLNGKIKTGQVLTAVEISELGRYEVMAKKKTNDKDVKSSAVELAEKQRHLYLLNKVKENKRLAAGEIKDLKRYEEKCKTAGDVLASAAAAGEYAGVSGRTIHRWTKLEHGLSVLKGGKYSKKLIDAFIERRQTEKKNMAAEKLKARGKAAAEKKKKRRAKAGKSENVVSAEYTGEFFSADELEVDDDVDMSGLSENEKDRRRKDKKRKAERDITIAPIKDPARRAACKNDWQLFCTTYYPEIFYHPFSDNQIEIGDAIIKSIHFGGLQADAAERGGGKSTITKIVAGVYGICYGLIRYLVLLGANGPFAVDMLSDIKDFLEFSDTLCEDFPEICIPVRALEGAAQRAGSQTINGQRARLQWSGREIIFPRVKDKYGNDAPSSGSVITTRGIDSAIRGLVKGALRPDLVIGDDLETTESARSSVETAKRKKVLETDVLGLSGPGRKMSVLILGTIIRKGCVIEQLTDRKLSPAWHGIRQKRLIEEPKNGEMWQRYMEMRKQDQRDGDPTARTAHRYYLDNRQAMDEDARVSNKFRFLDEEIAGDGLGGDLGGDMKRLEVTALQSCFNEICDMGRDNFNCEYQNEPTDDSADGIGIEAVHVQRKLSLIPGGVVPAGCIRITRTIDIRRREFHWCDIAWQAGGKGYIIAYGIHVINSPVGNMSDAVVKNALEEAILTALLEFHHEFEASGGYPDAETGEMRRIDLGLVDAAWMPEPVHRFCRATGGRYKPSRGYGTNSPQGKYRKPQKNKLPGGTNWHAAFRPGTRQIYYALNVDRLKQMVHEGFMVPETQNGSMSMFGDDPVVHANFADQILAEVWQSEFVDGKGMKEGFKVLHPRNHFLDTVAQSIAAAEMLKISVLGGAVKKKVKGKVVRRGGFLGNLPEIRT